MSSAPPRTPPRRPAGASGGRRPPRAPRRRPSPWAAVLIGMAAFAVIAILISRTGGGGSSGGTTTEAVAPSGPPPTVGVVAPELDLPMPARPTMTVAIDGQEPLQMRMVAVTRDGRRAAGAWAPAQSEIRVPDRLAALGGLGTMRAWVEARDAAGRVVKSGPIPLTIPARGEVQVVGSVKTTKPYVALVFDDGLEPDAMKDILATAKARKAGVTFCLNGRNVERWDAQLMQTMREDVLSGTLDLCSHGWSHETSASTTVAEGRSDLQTNAAMDRAVGASTVPFYRPPFGLLSPGIKQAASQLGYRWIIMWDIDPSDYTRPAPSVIAERIVGPARPGSIAVLHGIGPSAEALPAVIDGLKAKGLTAVTISRLLASGTPEPPGFESGSPGGAG